GTSVALSSDGSTALLSAWTDNIGPNTGVGSAYVFVRSGVTWSLQAQLVASDGLTNDRFGWSVALSADGSTALVGAPFPDVGANKDQGSAYVFVRSGVTWSQQAKIVASDGLANDTFGHSVALSADGTTALVGADAADVGANVDQGSAYVFLRAGVSWSQQAK